MGGSGSLQLQEGDLRRVEHPGQQQVAGDPTAHQLVPTAMAVEPPHPGGEQPLLDSVYPVAEAGDPGLASVGVAADHQIEGQQPIGLLQLRPVGDQDPQPREIFQGCEPFPAVGQPPLGGAKGGGGVVVHPGQRHPAAPQGDPTVPEHPHPQTLGPAADLRYPAGAELVVAQSVIEGGTAVQLPQKVLCILKGAHVIEDIPGQQDQMGGLVPHQPGQPVPPPAGGLPVQVGEYHQPQMGPGGQAGSL